jgi:hypothetical protein
MTQVSACNEGLTRAARPRVEQLASVRRIDESAYLYRIIETIGFDRLGAILGVVRSYRGDRPLRCLIWFVQDDGRPLGLPPTPTSGTVHMAADEGLPGGRPTLRRQ